MSIAFPPNVPLTTTRDGVIVVTGTRVSIDLIVAALLSGTTAEEIAEQYPTVSVDDVRGAIAYYLGHRQDVDAYLGDRRKLAREVRAANELRFPPQGIRDRLVERCQRGRE